MKSQLRNFFWILLLVLPYSEGRFELIGDGDVCNHPWIPISTEEECITAAKELNLEYGHSWDGPGDFPACMLANDGRFLVFFNRSPKASSDAVNKQYAGICKRHTWIKSDARATEVKACENETKLTEPCKCEEDTCDPDETCKEVKTVKKCLPDCFPGADLSQTCMCANNSCNDEAVTSGFICQDKKCTSYCYGNRRITKSCACTQSICNVGSFCYNNECLRACVHEVVLLKRCVCGEKDCGNKNGSCSVGFKCNESVENDTGGERTNHASGPTLMLALIFLSSAITLFLI